MSDWRTEWRQKARQGARRSTAKAKTKPAGTHTFVVQKAYCTPARGTIYTALEPRGVEILRYDEGIHTVGTPPMPAAQEARVTVRASQANWAEYLMERTQQLAIVGGLIDPRNQTWAAKYGGKLPTPWIEPACKEGHKIWQAATKRGK